MPRYLGVEQHLGWPLTELLFPWKRGNDHVVQFATSMVDNANSCTCVTDQARPARRSKIACCGSCQSRTRVNAVLPDKYQNADASRRPTSWAPRIGLAAWLRYPTS